MRRRRSSSGEVERFVRNVVIPSLLTAFSLAVLVYLLHIVSFDLRYGVGSSAIIFASFGASAFILFMIPRSKAARADKFVKSYLIGAALGIVGFYLIPILGAYVAFFFVMLLLALLLMAFRAEHPPGAYLFFDFLLYRIDYVGAVIVIVGVVVLLVIRLFLERAVYIIEEDIEELERREKEHDFYNVWRLYRKWEHRKR